MRRIILALWLWLTSMGHDATQLLVWFKTDRIDPIDVLGG